VFVIDTLGLADPLLSHLPIDPGTRWWPGHFFRSIPDGYRESVAADVNYVRDPSLHLYYERIRLITRGPILDAARFRAIVALNLGLENDLLRAYQEARRSPVGADSAAPFHPSDAVASVP
jgi:arabinofuranosyltransferase